MKKKSSLKNLLQSDSLWVALGFAINAVSSLLISALLARVLDVSAVGLYFLLFSLVTVLSSVSQMGLNISVVRFIGVASVTGGNVRAAVVKMQLMVLTISLIVTLVMASEFAGMHFDRFFEGKRLSIYLPTTALWVLFFSLRSFVAEAFRGFGAIKMAALFQRIMPNIMMLLALLFMLLFIDGVALSFVLMAFMLVNLALLLLAMPTFFRRVRHLPSDGLSSLNSIVGSAIPLWLGQLLQLLMTQIPLWLLAAYAPPADIAGYGMALRVAALISLPLLVANNILMNKMAKFYAENNVAAMRNLSRYSVAYSSLLSLTVFLVFAVFGELLLEKFFGAGYGEFYPWLVIISLGHVVNVCSGSPAVVLAMAGKERYVLQANIISAAITLLLSVYLISNFGGVGAALSTVAGLVIVNVILAINSNRVVGCQTRLSLSAIKLTFKRVYP